MAEATPDNIASARTVDDLFQILIARHVPPFEAKDQINQLLRLGRLLIDSHVAAGARKESPRQHWANPEEPAEAPTGGITTPVNPQCWDRVFVLAIRDNHLIVEPLCALDFPWRQIRQGQVRANYSFPIANPAVLAELGFVTASEPAPAKPVADAERPPADAAKPTQIAWAYGELLKEGRLAGLRGKVLREKVFLKVGPDFNASGRSFAEGVRLYKGRND
jgi:hypothetical protein